MSERAELIAQLTNCVEYFASDTSCYEYMEQAAAMLEADARELEGEHSPTELRQMLDESFEEKKKCWFTVGQLQKAIKNLIKERDEPRAQVAAPLTIEQLDALADECTGYSGCLNYGLFARAIEAHHKIGVQS